VAYASEQEIATAAGGPERLIELADHDGDGTVDDRVLVQAQKEADAYIDSYARRLFEVPFPAPVPDFIRLRAAAETVYVLKGYRNATSEEDRMRRAERDADLRQLQAGKLNPLSPDPYPTRTGGGTPCAVERDGDDFGRNATKGFW
jgi:phage gp36-like protein